jgi:hypothetical protein
MWWRPMSCGHRVRHRRTHGPERGVGQRQVAGVAELAQRCAVEHRVGAVAEHVAGLADGARAEARARAVGGRAVPGDAGHGQGLIGGGGRAQEGAAGQEGKVAHRAGLLKNPAMIGPDKLGRLHAAERERFRADHPRSAALAAQAQGHWLYGLPMHWMRDWPLPHPLFVERAAGAALWCVDGHRLADFCLGDTGAMFGHSPEPVTRALAPGFVEAVQAACRRHGSLLLLDETHTVSSGHGGWARQNGVVPDMLVVGKAVAGGMPCAVYGFGDDLAARMARAKDAAPAGHSGIGTTLTASLLALAALRATLAEVNTAEAAAAMDVRAARLASGLGAVFRRHALPWTVTRLGARMELQFRTDAPRNADEARAAMQPELEAALHLWWLNRGVLVTPFHGMLLVPPMAAETDLQRTVESFGDFTGQLA